ncbi:Ribosomal RNA-processing protein 14/surfeit locus protein 6 C-terminal domain [Arabidopsis thaliana x Arabidopsis arenosa]|uniref:Ribosomal RNA-processing protein 14/surfeit locus protein 6 C-terminal domain n=1 Tax=Arabidopsis thaliana x Arabidopsis arenosa TaxID=1240361 RepID=A0A8T2A893_9BRAS|nr:Ribosomal RNA-processing protein 14/surfeit locus protein 6 C-terminal domain [Arabidopsis thaliana x Arabidopsis arenosa]
MTKKKVKLDLESDNIVDMIHRHADFSDKLINLIPARIYLSDDDKEKKWFQGLRKEEKVNAKRETIENLKKAKRYRLDPEKSVLTTLDLQKQKLEKEKEKFGIKPMFLGLQEDDTFEKMRERRLQKNKRKRDSGLNVVEEVVKDLTYGYVKIGDDDEEYAKNRKKKRVSKAKELEMAMKLENLKKDPEKGDILATKHSWKAAISRAAGIKVRDDPKRLKQRIRKEKNRREKNAEKWKERVEVQQKVRVEKQQKRSENITDRIQQKKMRKIAKREKKLLRPGY